MKGLIAETPSTQISFLELASRRRRIRSRAPGALGESRAAGEPGGARGRRPCRPGDLACARRRAFAAGGRGAATSKRYDEAFARAAMRPGSCRRRGAEQSGRRPASARRRRRKPGSDLLLHKGGRVRSGVDPTTCSTWATPTGRITTIRPRSIGCARRSGVNPADADAHFVLAAALEGHRRGDRGRSRAGARAASVRELRRRRRLRRDRRVPKRLERVREYLERPGAAAPTRRWRPRSSATRRSSRRSISIAVAGSSSARTIATPSPNCSARFYLSPYQAEAHLLLGRLHLRAGRTKAAIDALKISLWSEETPAAHVVLGEAFLQAKDLDSARKEAERALEMSPGMTSATELLARTRSAPAR